jgi:hypothetical protein
LVDINNDAASMREPGVQYVRVGFMESPAIPEFTPIFFQAKCKVAKRTNEINASRPDSDKAFVYAPKTPVGSGLHFFIEVAVKPQIPTIIHSMRQALKELNFPGYIPMGDE